VPNEGLTPYDEVIAPLYVNETEAPGASSKPGEVVSGWTLPITEGPTERTSRSVPFSSTENMAESIIGGDAAAVLTAVGRTGLTMIILIVTVLCPVLLAVSENECEVTDAALSVRCLEMFVMKLANQLFEAIGILDPTVCVASCTWPVGTCTASAAALTKNWGFDVLPRFRIVGCRSIRAVLALEGLTVTLLANGTSNVVLLNVAG